MRKMSAVTRFNKYFEMISDTETPYAWPSGARIKMKMGAPKKPLINYEYVS
jgi:hypothetical protein